MPSDKDRLYVALYYWAFIVGPKHEPRRGGQGIRFRVKEERTAHGTFLQSPVWTYEERNIKLNASQMLLVRVVIGKILDLSRLQNIFASISIRQGTPGWDCVEWAKEAVETILGDDRALGTSAGNWGSVRDTVMWYIGYKKDAHRFDGQAKYDMTKVPTWDMLDAKELTL
ncbi:hypothetical protein F4859DRAFT_515829 [Xylaria cf. heliscus]|nr:hypothetical protein F4859DRAFT_515829 [Xylaria cf. heliscus]